MKELNAMLNMFINFKILFSSNVFSEDLIKLKIVFVRNRLICWFFQWMELLDMNKRRTSDNTMDVKTTKNVDLKKDFMSHMLTSSRVSYHIWIHLVRVEMLVDRSWYCTHGIRAANKAWVKKSQ